ncbi:hypothetical protein CEXT_373751 [Caerostris extrusa]|uniref:Uncharacterized protein n=1 Tax=Caerostris extrusa TaxID=172846 RepID=A0AAV4WT30_CAEEX|nr:hypothetical protein CEXT_373751 [Caerostris extrusa]
MPNACFLLPTTKPNTKSFQMEKKNAFRTPFSITFDFYAFPLGRIPGKIKHAKVENENLASCQKTKIETRIERGGGGDERRRGLEDNQ